MPQIIREQNLGTSFGSAMSKGLNDSLKALIGAKVKQMLQRRKADQPAKSQQRSAKGQQILPEFMQTQTAQQLSPQNMAPQQNQNPVQAYGDLLQQLSSSTEVPSQQQQQQQVPQVAPQVAHIAPIEYNSAQGFSKKIKSFSGKNIPEKLMSSLVSKGFEKDEMNAITSTELTPNIVDFFLSKTKGSPTKARNLAKKYGFKV